jgi:hypothetical protein
VIGIEFQNGFQAAPHIFRFIDGVRHQPPGFGVAPVLGQVGFQQRARFLTLTGFDQAIRFYKF